MILVEAVRRLHTMHHLRLLQLPRHPSSQAMPVMYLRLVEYPLPTADSPKHLLGVETTDLGMRRERQVLRGHEKGRKGGERGFMCVME